MVEQHVGQPTVPHVLLMTRAACHLCDEAAAVAADAAGATGVSWSGHDVDADVELRAEFGDRVPVVLVAPRPPEGGSADALLDGAIEVGHFRITRAAVIEAIDRARGR
jgi:hypothetical protein